MYPSPPRFLSIYAHEALLVRKFPLEESVLTHWTFLTTYEGVLVVHLDDSQVTWAVVNSTWKSVQGMNLLLTSSTVQQSTPVLNKRDGVKTVTVYVLSGVVERLGMFVEAVQ